MPKWLMGTIALVASCLGALTPKQNIDSTEAALFAPSFGALVCALSILVPPLMISIMLRNFKEPEWAKSRLFVIPFNWITLLKILCLFSAFYCAASLAALAFTPHVHPQQPRGAVLRDLSGLLVAASAGLTLFICERRQSRRQQRQPHD